MLPVKTLELTGEKPEGTQDWKQWVLERMLTKDDPWNLQPPYCYRDQIILKWLGMEQGTWLTPERIGLLKIGKDIWPDKKEMLLEVLYTREAALTFEWGEIEQV